MLLITTEPNENQEHRIYFTDKLGERRAFLFALRLKEIEPPKIGFENIILSKEMKEYCNMKPNEVEKLPLKAKEKALKAKEFAFTILYHMEKVSEAYRIFNELLLLPEEAAVKEIVRVGGGAYLNAIDYITPTLKSYYEHTHTDMNLQLSCLYELEATVDY